MSPAVARNWKSWVLPLAALGYWLAAIHMLSPQWSVFAQYSYGWAVPVLCGYLLWMRWADRPAPESHRSSWPWMILCFALLLWLPTRFVVEANLIWRVGSWAMGLEWLILTLALLQLTGGREWLRHFWFPFAFYLVAIPWPSLVERAIVQGLTRADTAIVVESLGLIGIPAIQHGNVIEISRGLVGVDEACSGIRSLQATFMIALFFGEFYRLSGVRRIWLIACAASVAFLCNVLRTFTLVCISSHSGNTEMEKWHDSTGVAILLGCFAALWFIATKMRRDIQSKPKPQTEPILPQVHPRWLAAALCGWLILVEGANAAWFGFHNSSQPTPQQWAVKWPVEKERFRKLEISAQVRYELGFDQGESVAWNDANGHPWQAFHFGWGPAKSLYDRIRVQFAKTHRPEVCLPAAGVQLQEARGLKMFPTRGGNLPFQAFRFEDRGVPLYVYFCAWEDGRMGQDASLRESLAARMEAVKMGSRSLSQRVLEIAVWGRMTDGEADAALQGALKEIIAP